MACVTRSCATYASYKMERLLLYCTAPMYVTRLWLRHGAPSAVRVKRLVCERGRSLSENISIIREQEKRKDVYRDGPTFLSVKGPMRAICIRMPGQRREV